MKIEMEMVVAMVMGWHGSGSQLQLGCSLRAHDFYFIFVEFPKVVDLHGLFVSCCYICVAISHYIAALSC